MKETTTMVLTAAFAAVSFAVGAITRMDYPDADVVTLDTSVRIEYAADGTYSLESDESLLALTEKGVRSLRTVSTSVSRRYGDAEIAAVEIISPDGTKREVDFRKTLKEATDNSSVSSNIYDPLDRTISCSVPGMATGDVRRVVIRKKTMKPRMRDAFASGMLFESTRPIKRAAFELVCPKELPIANVKLRHELEGTVTREKDEILADGRVKMRWTAKDVPQAFPEADMPSFGSVSQKLLVSTVRSWQDVSKWYWNLCLPRLDAVNAGMSNKVAEIVSGGADRMAKIRALYKFVSQEIRYMGLTLEDESPGYAPHDVSLTFDNRYGVCRDKAALLASMFRIAGMEAYPVLVTVGPKMDEDVPLPYFNHAIVAVARSPEKAKSPSDFILMDPTNESSRDLLPAYLMDCSYLVAHPEGMPLALVPVKPADENAFEAKTKGALEPDGSAVIETSAEFRGINDLYRGMFLKMTQTERRRYFERLLQSAHPGAELLSYDMTPADLRDTETMLAVRLSARIPDLVVRGKTRDELTAPFIFSGFSIANRLLAGGTELEERRYPKKYASTAKFVETVELKLGDSVGDVLELPGALDVKRRGYGHARRFAVQNGTLTASRTSSVDAMEISPEEYLELKIDLETIEMEARKKPKFRCRGETDADVRTIFDRTEVRLFSPHSWVVTNTWEREVLTYAGKKASAELRFGYVPCVGTMELVYATVSNKNGQVKSVSEKEINELDAGWVAAAPRYPAGKTLVANLPSVETGSVIRVQTVQTVTNAPVAFSGQYVFDSPDPIGVKELEIACEYGEAPLKAAWAGRLGEVIATNRIAVAVTNPPALPRETGRPPALLWRNGVLVSAADNEANREALLGALEDAREAGSELAAEKARELAGEIEDAEGKIKAIRDWLWKNVRIAGPGMYAVPFAQAFSPPDRALRDGYASAADWKNAYCAMLESAGLGVEFALADNGAAGYPELNRAIRDVPQPENFCNLHLVAKVREGGFLGLFGGTEKEYVLDYENDCAPLGVRDAEGRDRRTEDYMLIDLNETGAARITVSNSTWGVSVAELRKLYTEMLPERRSRHFCEFVGNIAESAEAVSGLETDVTGYPFVMRYSVYAPNYATVDGDSLTLVIPGLGGRFLPRAETKRESPYGVSGRLCPSVTVREVILPEGFTEIEHLPESWEIRLPGEDGARVASKVEMREEGGRIRITVREELLPAPAGMFGPDWLGYFREGNRRTNSRLVRTVMASKRSE